MSQNPLITLQTNPDRLRQHLCPENNSAAKFVLTGHICQRYKLNDKEIITYDAHVLLLLRRLD